MTRLGLLILKLDLDIDFEICLFLSVFEHLSVAGLSCHLGCDDGGQGG